MSSSTALTRVIITYEFSMPHLVEVVANRIWVWLLIVSYLKKTGRRDDNDNLVVRSSVFANFSGSHDSVSSLF